ncbi:MAG: hypothetical protein U1F34_00820 [Gammaproteobacteria bacterium]
MRRAKTALVAMVSVCSAAYSADGAPPAEEDMLEYLGEFSTADGGWMDPQTLTDAAMLERANMQSPIPAEDEKANVDAL